MFNHQESTIQPPDSQSDCQRSLLSKSLLSLGIATLGVLTIESISLANQTQSSTDAELTVASILADPTDGVSITLRGQIIRQGDDEEEYVFTDGTGEITLEIYDEDFNFAPDMPIEISGEIDLESEDETQHEAHAEAVEIDVYQWQVINPEL